MLKIEQLNHYYGESHTLWDLALDIPQGQCTRVMGRITFAGDVGPIQ